MGMTVLFLVLIANGWLCGTVRDWLVRGGFLSDIYFVFCIFEELAFSQEFCIYAGIQIKGIL